LPELKENLLPFPYTGSITQSIGPLLSDEQPSEVTRLVRVAAVLGVCCDIIVWNENTEEEGKPVNWECFATFLHNIQTTTIAAKDSKKKAGVSHQVAKRMNKPVINICHTLEGAYRYMYVEMAKATRQAVYNIYWAKVMNAYPVEMAEVKDAAKHICQKEEESKFDKLDTNIFLEIEFQQQNSA
jgi:hypothetical protein